MTRSTPTRLLTLLLLGAATVSSGVLAAPTTSSMNSGPLLTGVAQPEGLQTRSSPEQGSLFKNIQCQGVEHVNLVPRADEELPTLAEIEAYIALVDNEEDLKKYQKTLARLDQDRVEAHARAQSSPRRLETVDAQFERDILKSLIRESVILHSLKAAVRDGTFLSHQGAYNSNPIAVEEWLLRTEYIVSTLSLSQPVIERAGKVHDEWLELCPNEAEKTAARERMQTAQRQRQLHSTSSPGGQRQ
ncbi:hypothetical protein C8R42DRAFT_659016 [Lentinula raphanica]|nr:hypothetical protein C8R42DRAFT_659016 [Lentinula raphanica]